MTIPLEANATWSSGEAVIPFLATPVVVDKPPIFGVLGEVSLDGGSSAVNFIDWSVTVETGIGVVNQEYGSDSVQGVSLEVNRKVTFSLHFLARSADMYKMGEWRRKVAQDVYITVGDKTDAGDHFHIDMATAEIDPSARSGEGGLVDATVTGTALATSAGENELALVFD